MPTLTATVQSGSRNKHDVALVQAMLRLIKNTKGQSYAAFSYDGDISLNGPTVKAIKAFQEEHKTTAGPPPEALGTILPYGRTFKRMCELLPATHKDLRALPNHSVVYVAGTQMAANASAAQVAAAPNFTVDFKTKLADLIRKFYATYGIVLSVAPKFANGGFRTFAEQQKEFKDGDSQAGPGESYHNWGNGADVGMDGFALLTGSGAIVTTPKHSSCKPIGDGPWLNKLEEVNAPAAATLWKLRNDLAAGSLYPTGLEKDMAHLQTFRDANVSMQASLAAHLTECARMYWEHKPGAYWCNYGLADSTVRFKVGTATKIWDNDVNVDEASLATALNQAAKRRATGPLPDYEEVIYTAIVALTADPPKVWKSTDIKKAHCDKMRAFFHADFELAESNHTDWIPLH